MKKPTYPKGQDPILAGEDPIAYPDDEPLTDLPVIDDDEPLTPDDDDELDDDDIDEE